MVTLVRDRLTWLVYAVLGVYGYFIYAFGPAVPLLREDQGTSRAVGGLHSTALAVGAIVSGFAFTALARRYGRGRILAGGLVGLAVGVVGFVGLGVLPGTLAAALVCGLCGATVVNATAPILDAHHRAAAPAAISEANAVATGTGAVAPLLLGAAVAVGLGWRAGLVVAVVGVAVVLAFGRGVTIPDPVPDPDGSVRRPLPRAFWPAWLILLLCIGVEFCVAVWASDLLRQRLGMADGTSAAALTTVIVGMTIGRVVGARLMLRRRLEPLLLGGLAVAAAGFGLLWTATSVGVALVGLAVLGLGMGTHYPLSISRAIAATEGQPDRAAGLASVGAGIAVGTAPFALGALADSYGTRTAFLLVPALLALAALTLLVSGGGRQSSTGREAGPARA